MKILGIDYGQKHIGLAIADERIKIAHPYLVLENPVSLKGTGRYVLGVAHDKDLQKLLSTLKKIITKENINKIIVGRPIGLSGNISEQTKITDEFINFLKDNLELAVESFDERFTSKMSEGEHSDAAAIILQDYLEKINNF